MTKREQARTERLMPKGIPRWVRVYDNGGSTADRFTVVFTGLYNNIGKSIRGVAGMGMKEFGPVYYHLFMSENPCFPQGVGITDCTEDGPIDTRIIFEQTGHWWPPKIGRKHPRLGKRIRFEDLPTECQRVAIQDYKEIWGLTS